MYCERGHGLLKECDEGLLASYFRPHRVLSTLLSGLGGRRARVMMIRGGRWITESLLMVLKA